MKFLLYMIVVTLSNAGRIPRSFDAFTHHNFPNLQTVHHGHGATSYQNVQIDGNQGKILIAANANIPHHYTYSEEHDHELQYEVSSVTQIPYFIDDPSENHIYLSDDAELYASNNIEHIGINNIGEPSHYHGHYDQEYDYGYH